ncbi:MAG TPA: VWA domain-containing protein [Terriglobia bacterium]|nr:VWA domain-containing protein [Terriglobia bacterium]
MKSLAVLLSLTAILQQAPVQPKPQRVQKLVINVNDTQGRFILNLRQQDFIVEENGIEQKITGFMEGSDTPISLGILIDKSLSMRLPLYTEGKQYVPAAILAANRIGRAVVKLMRQGDEFLLMTFDEKVHVKQNFTEDRKKMEDQLQKLNEVGNATHLYESVITALEKMKKAKYKRRALVVITDAYDTSGKELENLRARIAEQEIQVFTCGFRSVYEDVPNPNAEPLFQLVLRVLSGDTGGLSIIVDLPELQNTPAIEGLIGFSQIIAVELRGQYTLTYNTDQTGSLASRFVRVRSPLPQLRIRLRRDAEEPLAKPSK